MGFMGFLAPARRSRSMTPPRGNWLNAEGPPPDVHFGNSARGSSMPAPRSDPDRGVPPGSNRPAGVIGPLPERGLVARPVSIEAGGSALRRQSAQQLEAWTAHNAGTS